jgi:hypothetical protein
VVEAPVRQHLVSREQIDYFHQQPIEFLAVSSGFFSVVAPKAGSTATSHLLAVRWPAGVALSDGAAAI